MIITCPCGDKKFTVDASLIPQEGRTLQCGFCERQWFFKTENTEEEIKVLEKKIPEPAIPEPAIKDNKNLSENIKKNISDVEDYSTNSLINTKEETNKKINKKNDVNYFKILIVAFISFTALILVLDTFKIYISNIYPQINNVLNSLYESLFDIFLFFKDLIK